VTSRRTESILDAEDTESTVAYVRLRDMGRKKTHRRRAEGGAGDDYQPDVEHYRGALPFIVYMVLLSGALVATVGVGNPDWLRQFDVTG